MPITRSYNSLPEKVRPSGPHPKSQSAPDSTPEDTTLTPARSQGPEAYGPDREANYKKGGAVKKPFGTATGGTTGGVGQVSRIARRANDKKGGAASKKAR